MMSWEMIAERISAATGRPFRVQGHAAIGGGCINATYRISGDGERYFVKLNSADRLAMFEAEADGLRELARPGVVRIPRPVASGVADGQAYLVMEELELGGSGNMTTFAGQLAALHRCTAGHFGWDRGNTIGSTPQVNTPEADWVAFWGRQRLGFQLELAARRGAGGLLRSGERLLARIGDFFTDYQPAPSLLHGDLWSGNYAFTRTGEAVIFDPAVYYGDREADLAMTELFGGFGRDFYAAYNAAWALDPGYPVRRDFYNLYHVLNHYNMFGGGYGAQAERMIERLLSEVR